MVAIGRHSVVPYLLALTLVGTVGAARAQAVPDPAAQARFAENPFTNRGERDGERSVSLPADANPFDPVWLNNHAIDMAEQGWLGVAEQLLQRALKIAPDDPVLSANLERLRHWHQIRSSDYRPVLGYELEQPAAGERLPEPPRPWVGR